MTSFEELYEKYATDVLRVSYFYLGDRQRAEDVCQDVFVRLITNAPELEEGREKAWLLKVALNRCRDLWRGAWVKRVVLGSPVFETIPAPDDAERRDEEEAMMKAIHQLPAAFREAILLYYYQGYGAIQFRVSEAMTLLPILFPEAIPGLTVGCLISNLFNPMGATIYDIVFGTFATCLAAVLTWKIKGSIWLRALPPVICNAVIVGMVLTYAYGIDVLWMNMFTVGLGEAVVCYVLGIPLIRLLQKQPFLKKMM